jgi:hypothetical protein
VLSKRPEAQPYIMCLMCYFVLLLGRETGSLQLLTPLLLTGGKGADLVIRGDVVLNTHDARPNSCASPLDIRAHWPTSHLGPLCRNHVTPSWELGRADDEPIIPLFFIDPSSFVWSRKSPVATPLRASRALAHPICMAVWSWPSRPCPSTLGELPLGLGAVDPAHYAPSPSPCVVPP